MSASRGGRRATRVRRSAASLAGLCLVATAACSGSGSASEPSTSSPPAVPSSSAAASSPTPATTPASTSQAAATTKVLTVMIENHSLHQMQSGMPYLHSLATRYGYATDYRAVAHPSLPNYLAIAFGSTAGVTDDKAPADHQVAGESVFSLATRAGTGARLYAESMTSPCQQADAYPYAVKHNPWAYGSPGCAAGDVPAGTPKAGRLRTDVQAGTLPCAGMVIPDLVSDAHDGSLQDADRYLESWLPTVMAGPDFQSGRLAIVVTADEDDRSSSANRVLTVVVSRDVSHRVVSSTLTHYSLTRLYNTVCREGSYLGKAADAASMSTAFGLHDPS